MQKWEYCAIIGMRSTLRDLNPAYPALWHFSNEGYGSTPIKGYEAAEVAKTIAELGEQGWEMIGTGCEAGGVHILYFKRPKD
jgi:hypothetical protein